MIRKRVEDRFLLFTQEEHAELAGKLAQRYGNTRFALPERREEVIEAVRVHDCGWPLHDERPTLNAGGLPLDVFETPLPLALRIWTESSERAGRMGRELYTQLLVSLHGLGLSGFAASNAHSRHEMFELNKFQQREVERQEELRRKLGLRTDIPLRLGLAEGVAPAAEQQLRRHHFILQLMDRISLALCSTEPPFAKMENFTPRAGADPMTVMFPRTGEMSVAVDPWPFDGGELRIEALCRAIPAQRYESAETFAAVYRDAEPEQVQFVVKKSER